MIFRIDKLRIQLNILITKLIKTPQFETLSTHLVKQHYKKSN